MNNYIIKEADITIWERAQRWENQQWKSFNADDNDWNDWWFDCFSNFEFIKSYDINSILEVGCGPWAKNLRYTLNIIGEENKKLYLEDPLLNEYINDGKYVKNINAIKIVRPLEETIIKEKVDLIICINVLDHVYNVDKCFENMLLSLNKNGILIFGQDLSNEEDYKNIPTDIGHPIRIDLNVCDQALKSLRPIYKIVLNRDAGRNPCAHYGTLLYAGINE